MKVKDILSRILGVWKCSSGADAPAQETMKVKDILSDASKWTQFADARDAEGRECDVDDDRAVAFCLAGALRRAYSGREAVSALERIGEVIGPIEAGILSVRAWNDDRLRTFADVKKVLEDADV